MWAPIDVGTPDLSALAREFFSRLKLNFLRQIICLNKLIFRAIFSLQAKVYSYNVVHIDDQARLHWGRPACLPEGRVLPR